MAIIRAQKIEKNDNYNNNAFYAVYTIDPDGGVKEIHDARIINEEMADERGKAELLEHGYNKQVVEFTTILSHVNINDIIAISAPSFRVPRELNKNRFIVKSIEHSITPSSITTKITAVRYDL